TIALMYGFVRLICEIYAFAASILVRLLSMIFPSSSVESISMMACGSTAVYWFNFIRPFMVYSGLSYDVTRYILTNQIPTTYPFTVAETVISFGDNGANCIRFR